MTPVAVTGMSAICALGNSPPEIWQAIRAGRSGVAPVEGWRSEGISPPRAALIADFDPRALVKDRKLHKFLQRSDMLGIYAADQTISASGLDRTREQLDTAGIIRFNDRTAMFESSGGGTYQHQYEFFPLMRSDPNDLGFFGRELTSQVDPMWLLRALPNNVLCHTGIRYGFKGPNGCIVSHGAGGALALADAAEALAGDDADRALVVAHDTPIEPQTAASYRSLGLLAREELKPFDAHHEGTVLGEGAGALMLEKRAVAEMRGAPVIGEILGFGCTSESGGLLPVRSDGDGLSRAIRIALETAGLQPSEIGMVVAHANGTPNSDDSEAIALDSVFSSSPPPVTGFKWAVGHTIAAAGLIESVLALQSLVNGEVPGLSTLEEPASAAAHLRLSRGPQLPRSKVALVLSRGFGSINTALILRAGATP